MVYHSTKANLEYLYTTHYNFELACTVQVFPGDLLEHNYADPNNPGRLLGRTEVERRQPYFDQLEGNAQLVELIKTCLHNDPSQRPSAEQLVTALEGMRGDIEGPCGKLATADAVRQ